MIYFDNAATTMVKPPEVVDAVAKAMVSFGGVGRGVHPASLFAGRAVFDARSRLARLLGAPDASCVSFTANATAALNIAIQGLLPDGGRAVTTAASHNSVLRPLNRARDERSCVVDVVPVGEDASLDLLAYRRALSRGDVDIVCSTHSSNVTGDVYDVALMARLAHDAGAVFVLDAAQTAGALPFSMQELGVDVVCFTGHKSLFGPQGTGGVCSMPDVSIRPLLEGGSGFDSYAERHPRVMPESLEAGTLNAHGIAGLGAGVAFIEERGISRIADEIRSLTERFERGAAALPGVRVLGGHGGVDRTGIVAIDVVGVDSSELSDSLALEFGVCTRAGAHCAPLMHASLGTSDRGAVRFSFSSSNTPCEVDEGLTALESCLARLR